MKLQFLPVDHLESLKNSLSDNLYLYKNPDNKWIHDFFGNNEPFREFKKEVPEFKLYTDLEGPARTDVKNAEIVYKNLINLTVTQASDERLWAGLAHGSFYNYMFYRWGGNKDNRISNIKSRYFFGHSRRRSLVVNSLARLWWIGKYTYDEQYENPFELLKYFTIDFSTKAFYLFSSDFSSSEVVRKSLLIVVNNLENQGIKVSRNVFNNIIKYLNIIGGTYLLDHFTKSDLIEIIENYAMELLDIEKADVEVAAAGVVYNGKIGVITKEYT